MYQYLHYNENNNDIYHCDELPEVWFANGIMNKITIEELTQFDGINRDELPEFKKELFSTIKHEVKIVYEEIERNLDGRFGVYYEL